MQLTRDTYNLIVRLVAGVAAALLLTGAVAMSGGMTKGRSTDGLFYQLTSLHPDGVVMTVNQDDVTVEEYLYWLSYFCDYHSTYLGYMGITDLDTVITDGVTAGDYLADQAEEQTRAMIVQNAVIRGWADQVGITLTEADVADLEAQRAETVASLGGEEAFAQYLESIGISEDFVNQILSHSYLLNHLIDAYTAPDGALRPDDDTLLAQAAEHGAVTAKILVVQSDGVTAARELADAYAQRIAQAEDTAAAFDVVAAELGQDSAPLLYHSHDAGDVLAASLSALREGDFSGVIDGGDTCYLAIRTAMDMDELANLVFDEMAEERIESAVVDYNEDLLSQVDTLAFYQGLLDSRAAAQSGE